MTGFLASVSSFDEARLVRAIGADIIDLKNPNKGALGAVDADTVKSVVNGIGDKTALSATIGDMPFHGRELEPAVSKMHETGLDIIKVGVFAESLSRFALASLERLAGKNINIVLVFFAELFSGNIEYAQLEKRGIKGLMLDTCEKENGNLREKLDDKTLLEFVTNSKKAGLISGLAGSLTSEDIGPLLRLNPDYLGFRGALCKECRRNMQVDGAKVAEIRKLIPVSTGSIIKSSHRGGTSWRNGAKIK